MHGDVPCIPPLFVLLICPECPAYISVIQIRVKTFAPAHLNLLNWKKNIVYKSRQVNYFYDI